MLDRYVSGNAQRLSPEAPIPVLRPSGNRATLGGAANVALNVAALGGKAVLVGVIGDDAAGAEMQQLLAETDAIRAELVIAPHRPTTAKTRFMAGAHQLLRLDEETTEPLDRISEEAVLAGFAAALQQADIVVLSDYAKGVLCDPVLRRALDLAASQGCRVIADPKRPDFAAYRGVTVLTPNEHEVRVATHIDAEHDAEADRAGRAALTAADAEAVLVTRSAKGLTLVRREGRPCICRPAHARWQTCPVPAIRWWLHWQPRWPPAPRCRRRRRWPISPPASRWASRATAAVPAQELLAALHLEDLIATDRKLATLDQALHRVASLAGQPAAHRLRQWLLRPDPSRACAAADRGARCLRPADRGAEHRRLRSPSEGADAAGAVGKRAGNGDGVAGTGRSGDAVR